MRSLHSFWPGGSGLVAAAALTAVAALSGCAAPLTEFPLRPPLTVDEDRRPLAQEPRESFSSAIYDALHQSFFRPLSRLFAVDVGSEAWNVNALDEVPASSWYTPRLQSGPLPVDALTRGACDAEELIAGDSWVVVGAKVDGANPGFRVKGGNGKTYLLKLDALAQPERASAAEAIVSRLYYAAGYQVPCNTVTWLDPSRLRVDPKATIKERGKKVPLERKHLLAVLEKARKDSDGRYRVGASRLLNGRPVGPFFFQGVREDDANDVVPHEHRRELRASYLLAAWTRHVDAREQNSLDMFVADGAKAGHLEHHFIDFGDCFGDTWFEALDRRLEHTPYFQPGHITVDFLSLGLVPRPWDKKRQGPTGNTLSYYDLENFEPDHWWPVYHNPAFQQRTERDLAWMARQLALIDGPALTAIVRTAQLADPVLERELLRILRGRQLRILKRYLTHVSPLSTPVLEDGAGIERLCTRDLALTAAVATAAQRAYAATLVVAGQPDRALTASLVDRDKLCVDLPESTAVYERLRLATNTPGAGPPPLVVHLTAREGRRRLVGVER